MLTKATNTLGNINLTTVDAGSLFHTDIIQVKQVSSRTVNNLKWYKASGGLPKVRKSRSPKTGKSCKCHRKHAFQGLRTSFSAAIEENESVGTNGKLN